MSVANHFIGAGGGGTNNDLAVRVGKTTTGNSGYGGPLHNWDGTLVTPEESNNNGPGGYYDQLEKHAAADQGSWSEFLTGAGRVVAGVGLMGAVVAAPELAGPLGGGLGGAAAAGAIGGAAGTTLTDKITGKPVTLGGVGRGALMGAAGGALAYGATPATGALTNAGVPAPLASGIVKGVSNAGTSALGAGLSGGNVGNAALGGGVNGFLSGAVGNSTGSNVLGKVASGLGGMAIGNILGGSPQQVNPMIYSGGSPTLNGGTGAGIGSSTDQTLAGTIGGALPGLIQGAAGVYGSQNAAQAQQNADNSAINTQQSTLGNINNIWGTQQNLGQNAQTQLGAALGTSGQPADFSNFYNQPGYQFAVQQGTQAIQRQAASMGNAYTPNTAEAVGQYVTGTASQNYNNYISQLMGAAGLGNSANQGLQTSNLQTGANISQLQQNIGQAQASGVTGAANAVGGLFGVNGAGTSLVGAAGRALTGGGAPNGTGVGADPFAGTPYANNSGAFGAYNANNGPTAGDISNSTGGIGNINVGAIDTGSPDFSGFTDPSGDSIDWSGGGG